MFLEDWITVPTHEILVNEPKYCISFAFWSLLNHGHGYIFWSQLFACLTLCVWHLCLEAKPATKDPFDHETALDVLSAICIDAQSFCMGQAAMIETPKH